MAAGEAQGGLAAGFRGFKARQYMDRRETTECDVFQMVVGTFIRNQDFEVYDPSAFTLGRILFRFKSIVKFIVIGELHGTIIASRFFE